MRTQKLDGLLELADKQAGLSREILSQQRRLHDEALQEQETVRQFIATYDSTFEGNECTPAMLAHTRQFISCLSERLAGLRIRVNEGRQRVDQADTQHLNDAQKVAALELLLADDIKEQALKSRRDEQLQQDEAAGRRSSSCPQAAESGASDHV